MKEIIQNNKRESIQVEAKTFSTMANDVHYFLDINAMLIKKKWMENIRIYMYILKSSWGVLLTFEKLGGFFLVTKTWGICCP